MNRVALTGQLRQLLEQHLKTISNIHRHSGRCGRGHAVIIAAGYDNSQPPIPRREDQLAIVNVAVQVERLVRHQILAPAVASGAVRVVGMFFDLSTAHVYEVNRNGLVS
ncbi:carbonic anhydrase [Mycobacterium sp.]|uniref:carbonic anhydrase n=1 Tax=Mycobacterium sp. TaxID=1785 RepID=UPI003C725DCB